MTVEKPTVRYFYAYLLTPDAVKAVVQTQLELQKRSGIDAGRWTSPIDMHITALFLGDHPDSRANEFIDAGKSSASTVPPFTLTIDGVGRFPENGPARVLWAGAREHEDRTATRLWQQLQNRLVDIKDNHGSYRPHVTLCYVSPRIDPMRVDTALADVAHAPPVAMQVHQIALMQTTPPQQRRKHGGARYNTVQLFPLST